MLKLIANFVKHYGLITILLSTQFTYGETLNQTLCPKDPPRLHKEVLEYHGHKGGCEHKIFKNIPENSLLCLDVGLKLLSIFKEIDRNKVSKYEKKFGYLEFDVRETEDNEIVIYHAGNKGSIFHNQLIFNVTERDHARISYEGINKKIFKTFHLSRESKVNDLTKAQITQLYLDGKYCQRVPSLDAYFEKLKNLNMLLHLKTKVMLEIKDVTCNAEDINNSSAHKLIKTVTEYENRDGHRNPIRELDFAKQKIGFLLYHGKLKRLGRKSNLKCWRDALKGKRVRIYETGREHRIVDLSD